ASTARPPRWCWRRRPARRAARTGRGPTRPVSTPRTRPGRRAGGAVRGGGRRAWPGRSGTARRGRRGRTGRTRCRTCRGRWPRWCRSSHASGRGDGANPRVADPRHAWILPATGGADAHCWAYHSARELVPEMVPALTERLTLPDHAGQFNAVWALRWIGPPARSALPALDDLTTRENPRPGERVVGIDYLSRKDDTVAAPFCVA